MITISDEESERLVRAHDERNDYYLGVTTEKMVDDASLSHLR